MSVTTHRAACSADDVFAVLSDGWLYASWVVGAARVRDVDTAWPAVGSAIHHSIGVWPLMLSDKTICTEVAKPHLMVLRGRGWPLGEVSIRIEMLDVSDGCEITIREQPVAGPARLIPSALADPMLHARNRECLARLAYLAEGHAR